MNHPNVISAYRTAVQNFLAACDACRAIELEMTSEGGAASLFVSGDFTGSNSDLTTTIFANAVSARMTIEADMAANGNALYTNLNLLRP